ncbi:hypothetical protein [Haloglycomyces albus]|uniref:hypothetical protein n=1 Tax=Haloglycomyces albus TaxID=526067 RepID=UPI00046D2369|nr:hypothetical protein [Haloglycomyces albus]
MAETDYDSAMSSLDDPASRSVFQTNGVDSGVGATAWGTGSNIISGAEEGDITQVVASSTEMFAQGYGAVDDPLSWLIGNGVDFLVAYIQPLQDILGLVAGNPERFDDAISRWSDIEQAAYALGEEVQSIFDGGIGDWHDQASQAAENRLAELGEAIGAIGIKAGTSQKWLGAAQLLAEVLMAVIKGIITEIVKELILTWTAALASAVVTAGASTAAAGTWTVKAIAQATLKATAKVLRGKELAEILKKAMSNFGKDMNMIKNPLDWAKNVKKIDGLAGKAGEVGKQLGEVAPFVTSGSNNYFARDHRDNDPDAVSPDDLGYESQSEDEIQDVIDDNSATYYHNGRQVDPEFYDVRPMEQE